MTQSHNNKYEVITYNNYNNIGHNMSKNPAAQFDLLASSSSSPQFLLGIFLTYLLSIFNKKSAYTVLPAEISVPRKILADKIPGNQIKADITVPAKAPTATTQITNRKRNRSEAELTEVISSVNIDHPNKKTKLFASPRSEAVQFLRENNLVLELTEKLATQAAKKTKSPELVNVELSSQEIKSLYKAGVREFSGIIAEGQNFSGMQLKHCRFDNAKFTGSNFTKANVSGCTFTNADLSNTDFYQATTRRAEFNGTCYDPYDRFTSTQQINDTSQAGMRQISDHVKKELKKQNHEDYQYSYSGKHQSYETTIAKATKFLGKVSDQATLVERCKAIVAAYIKSSFSHNIKCSLASTGFFNPKLARLEAIKLLDDIENGQVTTPSAIITRFRKMEDQNKNQVNHSNRLPDYLNTMEHLISINKDICTETVEPPKTYNVPSYAAA